MDSKLRQLSERERGLLEKLLSADFPGRDELRTQISSLTAEEIGEDGTLGLHCDSGSPSPSKYLLAMEGWYKDADGMTISVMLHLNNEGFMNMLEILKYGSASTIDPPTADGLVLPLPEEGGERRREGEVNQ
jgi:hypothetical protein